MEYVTLPGRRGCPSADRYVGTATLLREWIHRATLWDFGQPVRHWSYQLRVALFRYRPYREGIIVATDIFGDTLHGSEIFRRESNAKRPDVFLQHGYAA